MQWAFWLIAIGCVCAHKPHGCWWDPERSTLAWVAEVFSVPNEVWWNLRSESLGVLKLSRAPIDMEYVTLLRPPPQRPSWSASPAAEKQMQMFKSTAGSGGEREDEVEPKSERGENSGRKHWMCALKNSNSGRERRYFREIDERKMFQASDVNKLHGIQCFYTMKQYEVGALIFDSRHK